jgi:RecB family exonuclease
VVDRARRRVVLTASDSHDADAVITGRSRFVDELGLEWIRPTALATDENQPISQLEAAAKWRSRLANLSAPAAERLAAIEGLLALERVDPVRWWFQRDWSTPATPLRDSISTSYSRLNALENCELQFVLGQELGLGGRAGYQAWTGKLFHKLVEECEDGKIERTQEALAAEALKRWRPQEFPSFAVSEEFKRLTIEQMIPHWMQQYGGQPAAAREKWFEFELDGAKIHGYIDRIGEVTSGGFRITDYKTGKPNDLTKGGENLQLGIYWMGVENDPDLAEFRPVRAAELAFVRGDKGEFKSAPWQPHGRDIPEWLTGMELRTLDLLAQLRERYADGQWRPSTQADCYFCEFKSMCSLYPEGRALFHERPTVGSAATDGGAE